MAVDDLPLPVVNFLNVIGVPWPYLNEDSLTEFASLTRDFATAVETTHKDATTAIAGIATAKPLFAKIEAAMTGLDWSQAGGTTMGPASGFSLDATAVAAPIAALRTHAATMRAHGARYQQAVANLAF